MENKNTIKIAYVIFLVICAIYHTISDVFHLEFENWKRIICAATIASYFFSGASAKKTILSVTVKINDSLKYSNKELITIKNKWEQEPEKNNGVHNVKELDDFIDKNNIIIQKVTNDIAKNNKSIFVLNVIGFVVFFCILTFGDVFSFFEKGQDYYTLIAFILILGAETYQENWVAKHSSLVENAKKLNNQEENENE